MKRILLSLVAIATLSLSSLAQAPESVKYQSVIRDGNNTVLTNQPVGMRLTIKQGSETGPSVYSEIFSTPTNQFGLVNLEIGTGSSTDNFGSINWANGPYFIETATDITGGTSYVVMGTSQLMSVPYSLHSNTSGYADSAAALTNPLWEENQYGELKNTNTSNPVIIESQNGIGVFGQNFVDVSGDFVDVSGQNVMVYGENEARVESYSGDVKLKSYNGNIDLDAPNVTVSGEVMFNGNASNMNAPQLGEHLANKDYVDVADAALLDSINALDSTLVANTLWEENQYGELKNTNTSNPVIIESQNGIGVFGQNFVDVSGDFVDVSGQNVMVYGENEARVESYSGDVKLKSYNGNIDLDAPNVTVSGEVMFNGNASNMNAPQLGEHLANKDYVDVADAALLDSINALDSTLVANTLWEENQYGELKNTNTSNPVIIESQNGIGVFGQNFVDVSGDFVDVSGQNVMVYGENEARVESYSGDVKLKSYNGNIDLDAPNVTVSGEVMFNGNASNMNAPQLGEHLANKDYVDVADAALLDSINALDSTLVANTLWEENQYGELKNTNTSNPVIIESQNGIGVFGQNFVDVSGDFVNVSGQNVMVYGENEARVESYSGDVKLKSYNGNIDLDAPNVTVSGEVMFNGNASNMNAPQLGEHLANKDYVDVADAALLDSINALDSTLVANTLWEENQYGELKNTNTSNPVIIESQNGIGVFGQNFVDVSGDFVNVSGQNVMVYGENEARVESYSGDVKLKSYNGNIDLDAPNVTVSGEVMFNGNASNMNAPQLGEHLANKDYVDVADAALLDSINALDSTLVANTLWEENQYGELKNTNTSNPVIIESQNGIGVFGQNFVDVSGDFVNVNGQNVMVYGENEARVESYSGDVKLKSYNGNIDLDAPNVTVSGEVMFNGNASNMNAPQLGEHLANKDYVDVADAALLDSINALDSTLVANTLWEENQYGELKNTNTSNPVIIESQNGIGVFGQNFVDVSGDFVNVSGQNVMVYGENEARVESYSGDVKLKSYNGNIDLDAPNVTVSGEVMFNGNASNMNAPQLGEHLANKDYVDVADAALLDSINALDSTLVANTLWEENQYGELKNTNTSNPVIIESQNGIGVFGQNFVDVSGDFVNVSGQNVMVYGENEARVESYSGDVKLKSYNGNIDLDAPNVTVSGEVMVNGNATILGDAFATSFVASSDKRFKKNILTVENALEKVLQLRGVNYYWRNNEFLTRGFDDKLELGLIAQEVEAVIPEIVSEIGNGYKGVEYQKLVALLIEAIKDQQAIIENQNSEMAEMKSKLEGQTTEVDALKADLESRLSALEEMLNTSAKINKSNK